MNGDMNRLRDVTQTAKSAAAQGCQPAEPGSNPVPGCSRRPADWQSAKQQAGQPALRAGLLSAALGLLSSHYFRLFAVWLFSWSILAGDSQAAEPQASKTASASDALFDPGRVIQVEVQLDPKDWHELRISHRRVDEATGEVLGETSYK